MINRTGRMTLSCAVALFSFAALHGCDGGAGGSVNQNAGSVKANHENGSTKPAANAFPVGLKDEEYATEVVPRSDVPARQFEVVEGSLPPGLVLDPIRGSISGRPAITGDYQFSVKILTGDGRVDLQRHVIIISESAGSLADAEQPSDRETVSAGRTKDFAPQITTAAPDVSDLLAQVAAMPEGSWLRVNVNKFSDAWTPADLRQLYNSSNPTPSKIILAWSGFAWDPNRAAIVLYGGGHANYRGNDTYMWRAGSMRWERASLPSAMIQDPLGNWNAIDGVANAPASAHTYDNNIYLPIVDRMLVLGGAADSNGGPYLTMDTASTSRKTGPYFFDPSRADPNKVGGTTGSHVKRVAPYTEVVGGQMWSNREAWLNASALSAPPTEGNVNGCTGYAEENGTDVVYVRTVNRLYRYQVSNVNDPKTDRWSIVGRYFYAGSGAKATCGYDPVRKVFVTTNTAAKPFVAWDLTKPGSDNRDIVFTPVDPSGVFNTMVASGAINLGNCGMEYDPPRGDFKLWCGGGGVWRLKPPATISANGWVIEKAVPTIGAIPTEVLGTGILGKWRYAVNLDAFVGLLDPILGNVWVYKPSGWAQPGGPANLLPSVQLTNPVQNVTVSAGSTIALAANALDGDGVIARVEFFAGNTKIGQDTIQPYELQWQVPQGTWLVTARATDNSGGSRNSAAVTVTAVPTAPPNTLPLVSLVKPVAGQAYTLGDLVIIEVTATDSDGVIQTVEFLDGSTVIATRSNPPFSFNWTNAAAGSHAISVRATDNQGGVGTSQTVNVFVNPPVAGTKSVTIQRGQLPGAVVMDTYLSTYHQTLSFGATTSFQDQGALYTSLLRFGIFQPEGPIPVASNIKSAVLSVYKYSSYNMTYNLHRLLVPWSEAGATWAQTGAGAVWTVPGANGSGSDIGATADAVGTTGFDPGWVSFDVTSAVREFAANPGSNFGWRLRQGSGYTTALKRFYSSEFATTVELRPKLVITYE